MVPLEVWDAARREYHCVIGKVRREDVWPVRHDGKVVGFYYPHDTKVGRRVGPLFVLPEYRGRGFAMRVYAKVRGPLVACVRDDNQASIRLHEKAGFVRWRRYAAGWWWRRP